ncbi:lipase member H-A-like [Anticarsia gemmatalis]|uniref:lipase member H-A-like n=1 Tax=Anticarsia gemmatalis TaxID=129554 RepID=UPI003F75BA49
MFHLIYIYLFCVLTVLCEDINEELIKLDDCPGTNIEQPMSANAFKLLTISVQRNGNMLTPRSIYNYYQMKELVKDPNIDFDRPTMLYVGGYLDHPKYLPAMVLGAVYKKLGYNVLLLDTNSFTMTEYPVASRNMRTVGKHTAEMLVTLTKYGLDPKKLSLIGLSLGAQTAGFIAKNYQFLTGRNISRITGLDPAGPCFRNLGPEDRLDQSDADFVDVIETNIDGYGMAAPIGHVNFYVNGGEYQPGDIFWMPCNVLCSHIRSLTLWVAALNNPKSFIAIKCNSVQEARDRNCFDNKPLVTNVVGLYTNVSRQGIYYLATNNNYPYFSGEKGLLRENDFFDKNVNLFRRSKKGLF